MTTMPSPLEAFLLFQIAYWSISGASFVITFIRGTFYKTTRADKPASNVVLVIVTKASRKVKDSLHHTIDNIQYLAKKYNLDFKIIIDEGAELQSELESMYKNNLIVVPKDYRPDLVGKGRAINYFVEKFVRDDYWYAFVDDDNLILTDDFLYEIPYYERDDRYVAANPVLVPRRGRSVVTYILDAMRYFMDVSYYRFFTGIKGKPLIGLHGELLVVRGSVLKKIGFGKRSIVEDFYFAGKLVREGYKTWQSRTKVSILSPNSLKDFFTQRGRWFTGILGELKDKSQGIPWSMRLYSSLMMGMWILSPAGAMIWWVIWPLLIRLFGFKVDISFLLSYVFTVLAFVGCLYCVLYGTHVYKYVRECLDRSRRERGVNIVIAMLVSVLLSLGVILFQLAEAVSWAVGLLVYKNKDKFIVIDKNTTDDERTFWDKVCSR